MTATQESKTMHEMVHCEADQLVYADVFSASMVHPKPNNQILKLKFDDDRVDYVELSHSMTTDAHNVNPDIDSFLNLDDLLIHIKKDATQVWYQLGEALGIKKAILDKFTTCSPEGAIIEMLDYWLRNHTGKPTWKEVADALRKIHLHESALRIETLSKTGEFSVATDLNLELSHIPQELLREKESLDDQHGPVLPKGIMKIL